MTNTCKIQLSSIYGEFGNKNSIKNNIEFDLKKYKWGWSVWIKSDKGKLLLGSKLKKNEAENIIKGFSNPKINYVVKGQ